MNPANWIKKGVTRARIELVLADSRVISKPFAPN